jgi:hypothetical protein
MNGFLIFEELYVEIINIQYYYDLYTIITSSDVTGRRDFEDEGLVVLDLLSLDL